MKMIILPLIKNEQLKFAKIGFDEVAFSSFNPLPGPKLYDQLVKKEKFNTDWTSLISIDDLSKIVSWSEYIPSKN